ncbi:MAG: hypothetical protein KAU14_08335, partial [Thermoplasmata archaeon]|nr:hypothetical protein [Thermoplasmata archaeon]
MLVSTMLMGCLNESDSDDEEETEYYPPIISILSPRNYETVSGMVEIEVRVVPERPGVVIAYYIDEILLETSQSTSFSWDTTETENRQHLLEVTALETGENVPAGIRPSKAAVKVNVYNPPEIPEEPNTPPTIEMFAPSGDAHGVYRGPIVVRGKTADEETRLDNIEMRIDEDEWFQVQVSRKRWHYTLDPGSFTGEVKIEVRAFDGNDYSEIASMVLECDNTAPDIAFLNQNDRDTISGIITLQADVEDDHDLTYISFSINDIELQNSTGNSCELDTKEFENGDYTLMIEAADILENYARKSISVTIHNNHPPEVTITSPKNGSTHRGNITVKGTVSDPEGEFSSLEYRLDNGEWDALSVRENWSFTLNTTGLEDGEHTLEVRAEDDKGATDTASLKFISDNTAPVVDITSPTVEYVRGMVDIEAEITENGSGLWSVEFRIKNETVQSGTDTSYEWDTTKEDDGPEYRIEVIATDNTGSNGSDEITVLVDNTPPEITGISPADGTFLSGTVNIDPPLRDTGSGIGRIIFTLDGNEVKNSTSRTYSWNTTFYEDGSHEVGIRVFDRAGNSGEGGYTYFVDNTAPSVEITSPEEGAHIQGEGSIRADVSDNIGGSGIHSVRFFFNALIQGTDYEAPYKFDFNSDDYTDGDYTVTVMVRDIAGNTAQDMVGIRLGEVIDPIISDPHTNHLSPYDVAGKERLIFEDYRAVPIVSSRVRNGGVMPSVNWSGAENPKDSLNINMPAETGYAGFSGNIALSYWSTPEKAIVVDNYQHALMMTAYASIMDYPIIVYDSANPKVSDEALWKIETIYATQIITLGITPYNDKGVTVFTEDDIVPEAIGAAQFKGIMLDYITVVNPDDMPGISNTGYLSCFAGVFASHHNGLIVPCRASANEMNTKIHNAINALNESGMPAKHIAIVGDHKSLPMINEGGTPSDNSYADLDGNKYTIEISIGRIVAKELHDLSYYADRV